jgi:glutamate-1-semialdehyde 2,1-aminomutase/spore coat polysaccharide biosynthesis protein SpsF
MTAARDRIAGAGLSDVIGLAGAPPWAILTFRDHPQAGRDLIKTLFLREMIAAGVLLNASHNICFAHSPSDMSRVLAAYDHALDAVRGALNKGDLARQLGNQIIRPIFTVRAPA